MKILLLSPLPPPVGGIATWTELFINHCFKIGHEVRIVNTALIGERSKQQQSKAYIKDELFRNITILLKLKQSLKKFHPDIVYINTSCSQTGLLRDSAAVFLARKYRIVLHCHCDVKTQIRGKKLSLQLMKYMMQRASQIFVLNMQSLHYLKEFSSSKLKIVPNFIQGEYVIDSRAIRPYVKTVIYVGHIVKTKGLLEILQAAKQLPDLQFRLVGPVIADMREYNVPSNVLMTGRKSPDMVRQELLSADIFLFPSYTEGFSLALLEAMATGVPIIATDVGANRDMIEDCGGIIIPAGDSQSIVEAIHNIIAYDTRRAMSTWNIQKVKETYTKERVLKVIFNILKDL